MIIQQIKACEADYYSYQIYVAYETDDLLLHGIKVAKFVFLVLVLIVFYGILQDFHRYIF